MKTAPFDLEKALAGHPLVTRDGRKVKNFRKRLDNFDGLHGNLMMFPFRADEEDHPRSFTVDGAFITEKPCDRDLFLALPDETPAPDLAAQVASLIAERDLAVSTLERAGWTHVPGAAAWKPPVNTERGDILQRFFEMDTALQGMRRVLFPTNTTTES